MNVNVERLAPRHCVGRFVAPHFVGLPTGEFFRLLHYSLSGLHVKFLSRVLRVMRAICMPFYFPPWKTLKGEISRMF